MPDVAFDLRDRPAPALVGMVHLGALPGSPGYGGDVEAVYEAARRDAERLVEGGCDALMVENTGDVPYRKGGADPETVAAMAVAIERLRDLGVPLGVQVLAAANREALGVAVAAGASFLRVEGFAYAHVADEGWIDACAADLLRARRALGGRVAIWADVKKKHASHAVTADLSLAEAARGALFCGADVLVVTGTATGEATDPAEVEAAARAGAPVAVGSGVEVDDVAAHARAGASALIVGSSLKESGDWRRPVVLERVRALRAALDSAVGE